MKDEQFKGLKTVIIDGLIYKIGRFGKAYYWDGDEWKRSNKHHTQIENAIKTSYK